VLFDAQSGRVFPAKNGASTQVSATQVSGVFAVKLHKSTPSLEQLKMAAFPHTAKLAAYSSAATHGGVAAADPHRLIIMLMDGALERLAQARGLMERKDYSGRADLINRSVQIIGELQASLNLSAGGEVAANLNALYDYMAMHLLKASLQNDVKLLDEVSTLLRDIRGAWAAIPSEARTAGASAK
jgi:flagellar protein FliS